MKKCVKTINAQRSVGGDFRSIARRSNRFLGQKIRTYRFLLVYEKRRYRDRRFRTASAKTPSTGSVCAQLKQASVIDTP